MKTKDGFIQGYNAQAAVDATAQVIVATASTRSRAISSQSQPSSGQPATGRKCPTPRFARPNSCRSRAGSGAACSSTGRAGNRALTSARTCAPGRAGGCGAARSLSDRSDSDRSDSAA